ncbi:NADP-dependent oxidoreductase domain-containing protein [Cristinia sonorae]|uniref:NADP-dependent oxidoreductase domain-containing protein n=1 Tax=Cristinia sonorae TaxID=1940300 RepID=A0A8K0XUH5_9AGAR|nr:NADP-dependent oxidoreductase domain-containing protein [Cristinia sonorae]
MTSAATYPKIRLGGPDGPLVSAIGFGAMSIGAAAYGVTDEKAALETLTRAADLGTTFWDTSDAYGASQRYIGKWFKETGRRKEIFFATKFGTADTTKPVHSPGYWKLNSKPSFVKMKVEEALRECQTDYIDLFYQHRVDPEVPVEVVMEALRPYVENGTIKWIGISEPSIEVLRRAKAVPVVGPKIIAAQMEFSPFCMEIESSGFAAAAKELGVSIIAYSPLGRGMMTGQFTSRDQFEPGDIRHFMPRFSEENFSANLVVVDKFKVVAQKHNVTPGQVTLAWILARHPDFVSIPGTRSVKRLEENAQAVNVKLDEEDLKLLNEAVEVADVKGERFPPAFAHIMNQDCIPLSEWKGEITTA